MSISISANPIFPLDQYQKYELLVEGIKTPEEKKRFLIKHMYENEDAFKIRLNRSVYRNFANPVVTAFTSAINASKPVRELPLRLVEYIEDVNKKSEDADNFFNNVAFNAAKHGLCYVYITLPSTTPQTLEQAKALNHRPYFILIEAHNVLRYEEDYAIIRNVYNSANGPFDDYEVVEEYTIIFKETWQKFVKDQKTGDLIPLEDGVNGLGIIPLVPFYFKKKQDYVGISCLNEVSELIISLFRKDSELDKALFDSAIPLLFIKGLDDDGVNKVVKSTDNAFTTNSEKADAKYIEPSGISFEYLFKSIEVLENSIREIALRQFKPVLNNLQSAESKAIDKEQFDNIVSNFAKNIEDAETLCWYYFDLALNNSGNDEIIIKYSTQQDINKISDELLKAFAELVSNKIISKSTYYKILNNNNLLPEAFDEVEEQNIINAESFVNQASTNPVF